MFVVGFLATNLRAGSASGVWSSKFPAAPGANGTVYAMAVYGTNLIAAGDFTTLAGMTARGLARFDGQSWSEFGGGIELAEDGLVYALLVDGTNLYAGGIFHKIGGVAAENIARWTGDHWEALGEGITGNSVWTPRPWVSALYKSETNLFAGGSFARAGSAPAFNVARWDGSQWNAMDRGVFLPSDPSDPNTPPAGRVNAVTGDGTNVYVGGMFLQAGGVNATNLAMWNGSSWQSIGSTSGGASAWMWNGEILSGIVNSLTWFENKLWLLGDFTRIGDFAIHDIATWNGAIWNAPLALNGWANTAKIVEGDLFISGAFDRVSNSLDNIAATNIVKIHNGGLSAVNAFLPGGEGVYTVENYKNALYAGGSFAHIGGVSAGGIAKLDATGWRSFGAPPGNSPHGIVNFVASDGSNIYLAGNFAVGAENSELGARIAHWNGLAWSFLPLIRTNVFPWHLALVNSKLYTTGFATVYDGIGYNSPPVMSWDGQSWNEVANQTDLPKYASGLLVVQSNLFVSFTNATKWWNGADWTVVPWITFNYYTEHLGTDGTNVYIARDNTNPSNVSVACWDGTNVTEYPAAPISMASAIGASGTNLWVSGWSWSNRQSLVAWNGSYWIDVLDLADNAFISSMVGLGDKILVAGTFASIGGVAANSVALWNGSGWSALDRGVRSRDQPGHVWGVHVVGKRIYVAGEFDQAGGNSSGDIAVWFQAQDVTLSIDPGAPNAIKIFGALGDHVQVEAAGALDNNWTALTDLTFSTPIQTITDPRPPATRFYRAKILEP
jgi:hypothetical protein